MCGLYGHNNATNKFEPRPGNWSCVTRFKIRAKQYICIKTDGPLCGNIFKGVLVQESPIDS